MIVLKDVLVATDFSPQSEAALNYGRALARAFGATLHVLHVTENLFMRPTAADPYQVRASILRTLEDRLTSEDRTQLHAHAVLETSDHAADAIMEYAKSANVDLIVMGTHGRSGLSHLLVGSVAERVVRHAPCPVLTIRQPEHEFVVPDDTSHDASQVPATVQQKGPGLS